MLYTTIYSKSEENLQWQMTEMCLKKKKNLNDYKTCAVQSHKRSNSWRSWKHVPLLFSVLQCSIECHKRCVLFIWYSAGMCSALNAADVQDARSPAVQTRKLGLDLLVLKGHDLRNTPMPFKCVFLFNWGSCLLVGTQTHTHIKTQAGIGEETSGMLKCLLDWLWISVSSGGK